MRKDRVPAGYFGIGATGWALREIFPNSNEGRVSFLVDLANSLTSRY
jgi:hypothetical protein